MVRVTEVNVSNETLTAEVDAHGVPYPPDQLYIRRVMQETSHLNPPKVFEERAKRYLEAEKQGIFLPALVLGWAKKVLEIE